MKIDRKKMSLRLEDLVDSMCEVTGLYDKRSLNKYTSIASEWIGEMPAFIADEMGLGKTIMMIGLMVVNYVKHTLIVVPPVLIHQWFKEIYKTTGHKAMLFYGENKNWN